VDLKVIKCDRGVIFLHSEKDGTLHRASQKSNDPNESGDIPVSQTILKYVLDTKCAVLTSDAGRDARFVEGQSIFIQHIKSAACVPLICRKKVVGVLQVESTVLQEAFKREDLALLTGIGGQAAVAIENASLLRKAEAEAEIRTNLQRYLPPQLAQQVIQNKVSLSLGGETQKITILFSDVRGFTRMTEEIGAREVVGTLNQYFSRMVGVVFKHGGTLDKFIGDAIMAMWGAPVPQPDDALRATMAAIEMQRELFMLNLQRRLGGKKSLHMGVGLNTGEAVVGNMGAPNMMQFTAMGGVVNQGSRIEGKTTASQVLVSAATLTEVGSYIRVIELPAVELKGIKGLTPIWSVLGLATDAVAEPLKMGRLARVQTFLRMTHGTTSRVVEGRGFDDEVAGEFGVVLIEQDAAGFVENDLVCISPQPAGIATTLPPPEDAAKAAVAMTESARLKKTEISQVPLIFRIGKVVPGGAAGEDGTVRLTFTRLSEAVTTS
jgi:adenylate cyclase